MNKKTALIALLAVFIFSSFSITALAADDVEWVEKQGGVKLYWGDSVTEGDYTIKAEDFSDDMVFVSISMNGKALKTSPLSAGMELVYDDRIKICAKNVDPNYEIIKKGEKEFKTENKNPFAELNISVRGEPDFSIEVETDKDAYDPGDRIDLSITAKNDGDAEARDIVLTVNAVGMEIIKGKAEHTDAKVPKGTTMDPVNLTLEAPAPWEETEYNITAKIACLDAMDREYEYAGAKTIKVGKQWNLVISKTFPNDCYMGENVHVSVTVRNRGLCDIDDIELNDSVVSGMHLKENNTELNKKLSLKSGEMAEKVFEYILVPDMPGEFTFPPALAVFTLPNGESKELSSNISGTFKVYGPNITVTKTVDKQQISPGDELNVTLTALNTGNVNANVTVTDTLPSDSNLVSGEVSFGQILASGGGSKSVTYTMRMDKEGEIRLPACKARFIDLYRYSGEVKSEAPVVYVGSIALEGNNTQSEGANESSQDNNESSDSNSSIDLMQVSNEVESGNVPGFGLISSLAGLLTVTCLLQSRRFRP